jgi:tripartite-type tricarboxylate transporter receptor subunit TctC
MTKLKPAEFLSRRPAAGLRRYLPFLLGLASVVVTGDLAAQEYPSGPIKMVVPYAGGGPVDVVARLVGQSLSERLGKPIVIENRPGAGTAIGTATVARAAPDGYTLMIGNAASHAMNPALNKEKVGYDPVADFEPISLVASMPLVLVISPTLPPKSLRELVAYAKERKDLTYASAGSGSSTHMIAELFKQLTGTEILHVPYRARAPAEADVISGRVSLMFDSSATAVPRMQDGQFRGLGVTSRQRLSVVPELPTVSEAGYGDFWADLWIGIFAPAKTPAAVITKVNREAAVIMQVPEMQQRLTALGGVAATSTPGELGALVRSELDKWSALIKQTGITSE